MHVNKANNKIYVGITSKSVKVRWGKNGSEYLKTYKNGTYKHPLFSRALKKYKDWNNDWNHIIFDTGLSELQAKHIEKLLIALYKTNVCKYGNKYGYNCTDGGDGSLGYKHGKEAKQKMSQKQKGKKISQARIMQIIEEQSIPIVQLDLNYNYINEYKSAVEASKILKIDRSSIRKCINGRFFTCGGCLWIDKIDYENGLLPRQLPHGQKYKHGVRQYDLNGNLVSTYGTMSEAEKKTGVSQKLILKVCLGVGKSAGGYLWLSQQDYDNGKQLIIPDEIHRNNISVLQISCDGGIVAEYSSIMVAHRETGIHAGSICQCCKNNNKSAGGFKWIYKSEYDESKSYKWINTTTRNVIQLTLDEEFIAQYDSIKAASKITGIHGDAISHCCRGKNKTSGGYRWMYLEDYNKLTKQND